MMTKQSQQNPGLRESFPMKLVTAFLVSVFGLSMANAGSVHHFSDTLSTIKASSSANHSIIFTTPTGIGSGATVVFTLPSEFVIPAGLTFADIDINTGAPYAASSTLAGSPAGATVGVVRTSTTTITITNGTTVVPASTTMYIRIGTNAIFQSVGTFQIVNATTSGLKTMGLNGSFGDTGSTSVVMIPNDTVQISAIVAQAFSFTLSTTTVYFGTLATGDDKFASSTNPLGDSSETIAHTMVVSTNAPNGYSITVRGQTLTSLQNASTTISAIGATAASSTLGTSQFGLRASSTGGSGATVSSPYAFPTSYGYNGTATTSATLATGSGPTNPTTFHLRYVANISSLQEAGNYAAGIVYVATPNF